MRSIPATWILPEERFLKASRPIAPTCSMDTSTPVAEVQAGVAIVPPSRAVRVDHRPSTFPAPLPWMSVKLSRASSWMVLPAPSASRSIERRRESPVCGSTIRETPLRSIAPPAAAWIAR